MEGISSSLSSSIGSPRAPYLTPALFQAAGISFYDFPSYNGFSIREGPSSLYCTTESIESLATLFQSWLFFELLSSFLDLPIERTDFVVNGVIELEQASVHVYFKRWRTGVSTLTVAQRLKRQDEINKLINFAVEKCDVFEDTANLYEYEEDSEMFDRIALSVRLLLSLLSLTSQETFGSLRSPWLEYLAIKIPIALKLKNESIGRSIIGMSQKEARQYFARRTKSFLPLPPGDNDGGRASQFLLQQFAVHGWCPSRARQLCRSHDYLVANFLASLDLSTLILSPKSHHKCRDLEHCAAYILPDTSSEAYPFHHVSEHSPDYHCDFVSIDKAKVTEIIDSGGIPVVSMGLDRDDLDIKVERCTPFMTYTAISHVYSDGLGNPDRNSIYRCQLYRLRAMIIQTYLPEYDFEYYRETWLSRYRSQFAWQKKLSSRPGKPDSAGIKDRIYVWMDTFCIPRSPKSATAEFAKDEETRQVALQHITPIYAGAYTVLVLDSALKDAKPANAFEMSGARFAALILSTNWMQRGWTLEEGCLAQNCVFWLVGRPYDMSSALKDPLTSLKWQDSPLDRANSQIQQALPTLLKQTLLDEKRQLTVDDKIDRRRILKKMLRIPQFLRTWNSLQERSITRSGDRLVLFANLLDFNVYSLKDLSKDQRLPALVQSCHELPLSLLYNTGPRLQNKDYPEIGWIPTDFSDVKLVGGAMFHRIYPWWYGRDKICYRINRSNCEPGSIIFMKTLPDPIAQQVNYFSVQIDNSGKLSSNQKFYVELQRQDVRGSDSEPSRSLARKIYDRSQGTCIVIDLSYIQASMRGFAGRGARFSISANSRTEMCLAFDNPLVAYTSDQWRRKFNDDCPTTLHYDMQELPSRQSMVLKYGMERKAILLTTSSTAHMTDVRITDPSLWHRRLARRPLLTQHPASEFVISLFTFLLTFAMMILLYIFIPTAWNMEMYTDTFTRWYIIFSFILSAGAAFIPNKYIAMYAYRRWLRSFEKKWAA